MAQKGKRTTQKTRSVSKSRWLERKQHNWTIAFQPGTHTKKDSVPLGFALRDLIGVAKNLKEVKHLLQRGEVLVDGIPRSDYRFPVGLFDLIELKKSEERHRMLLDHKGRLQMVLEKEKKNHKLCRITRKTVGKGGMIVIGTNDGRTIVEKKGNYRVGDSLLNSFPEQKIEQHFSLEAGHSALVVSGKHVGSLTKIIEVIPSTMKRKKAVTLEEKGGKRFQTTAENIFVVGKEKPAIELKGAME